MPQNFHVRSSISGIDIPRIIYGSAWKKERTSDLVHEAFSRGFLGIDTACQPKHYYEKGVGEAIKNFLKKSGKQRSDLFVQTKFTSLCGQDPTNIPYNPEAPIEKQIEESVNASLTNLKVSYIDSLVLHSPFPSMDETLKAWNIMESFVGKGIVRQLGISNCYDPEKLHRLFCSSSIKPAIVQNRFYENTNYDKEVRQFCRQNGIFYQPFWTLTANPHILRDPTTLLLSKKCRCSPEQLFFRWCLEQDMILLTGCCNPDHMSQDLSIFDIEMNKDVVFHFNKMTNSD